MPEGSIASFFLFFPPFLNVWLNFEPQAEKQEASTK
jgi:hypothetical protein